MCPSLYFKPKEENVLTHFFSRLIRSLSSSLLHSMAEASTQLDADSPYLNGFLSPTMWGLFKLLIFFLILIFGFNFFLYWCISYSFEFFYTFFFNFLSYLLWFILGLCISICGLISTIYGQTILDLFYLNLFNSF